MPNNDNCINWAHVSIDLAKPDSGKTEIQFRAQCMHEWSTTPKPAKHDDRYLGVIDTLNRLWKKEINKARYVPQFPHFYKSRREHHPIFEPSESTGTRFYTDEARRDGLAFETPAEPVEAKPKRACGEIRRLFRLPTEY